MEAWMQAERDPERAAAARERFRAGVGAVADALATEDFLVGGRFSVADVMVGSALMFTARAGIADDVPPDLMDYLGRLSQRPAYQRAFQRTYG
jgi:glutathione S-transferase